MARESAKPQFCPSSEKMDDTRRYNCEEVGHVASDSSASTHDLMAHQPDEFSIPGLNLSKDAVHGDENSNSEVPVKDKPSWSDVSNDLGELRFANED